MMMRLLSTKKIVSILILSVCSYFFISEAASSYYKSRWLDKVLSELDWAKRKLDLNEPQIKLWDDGVDEFKQLLISMRGKRDDVRANWIKAAEDAESGKEWDWIHKYVEDFWYETYITHSKVVIKWDAFDKSLSLDKRKLFRSSMKDLVIYDWKHFSSRYNKYLNQHADTMSAVSKRFIANPTANDNLLLDLSIKEANRIAKEYENSRIENVSKVSEIMDDPNIPLLKLNDYAETNWNNYIKAQQAIFNLSKDYYNSSSIKEVIAANRGRIAAASFRKQAEMTPPSGNNN